MTKARERTAVIEDALTAFMASTHAHGQLTAYIAGYLDAIGQGPLGENDLETLRHAIEARKLKQ
ncbi:MAG: hypothetical protein J5J06_17870 [Phycisphaerae bacterium]|nr:hypothetical protein [Phycisphaerae bacterium]